MRVVVDTNVFISGVFFGGVPGRILEAWRDGAVEFVLSAEILDEYQRVGQELASQYPGPRAVPGAPDRGSHDRRSSTVA